jgi:dethiobiotin synthetase
MSEPLARPERVVVVAGTGTEIGKTWVGCRLLTHLIAEGHRVAARKPAQSFDVNDHTTDADELAMATGEDALIVCPPHRRYEVPMAPPMAAEVLGRPAFTVTELAWEVAASWPPKPAIRVGLIELAGGTRSPMASDGDGVDLAAACRPDVIVVIADAGLGTINAVSSTLYTLAAHASIEVVVHLNRYDDTNDLHRRNRAWLAEADGLVLTVEIGALARRVLGTA